MHTIWTSDGSPKIELENHNITTLLTRLNEGKTPQAHSPEMSQKFHPTNLKRWTTTESINRSPISPLVPSSSSPLSTRTDLFIPENADSAKRPLKLKLQKRRKSLQSSTAPKRSHIIKTNTYETS